MSAEGKIPSRSSDEWLSTLEPCSAAQLRKLIGSGGEILFLLDEASRILQPVWVLLVKDQNGTLFRVTTPTSPFARKLASIKQVYRIARVHGLTKLTVEVERKS